MVRGKLKYLLHVTNGCCRSYVANHGSVRLDSALRGFRHYEPGIALNLRRIATRPTEDDLLRWDRRSLEKGIWEADEGLLPSKRTFARRFFENGGCSFCLAERSLDLGFKRNLTTILNKGSRVESEFSDDLVLLGELPKLLDESNSTLLGGTCSASGKGDVTVKVLSPVHD